MLSLSSDGNEEKRILHSNTRAYRALLRKQWINPDSKTVLPDAYIPRTNGKDDNGLSVTLADSDTKEGLLKGVKAVADSFNKAYGVVSLVLGEVRALDSRLDIVPDPLDGQPNHALLIGVPRPDHNPAETERLAGQLARISQILL